MILPEHAACLVDLGIERNADGYRTVAALPTGMGPESVMVAGDSRRAYVVCSRSNSVWVYDLDRLEPLGEVAVEREPIAAVLDEPTGRLFTVNARSDSVSVIDTNAGVCGELVTNVAVNAYPAGLGYDRQRRMVLSGDTAGCTVSVIECESLQRIAEVPAELGVGSIAVDVGRGLAYAVNFFTRSISVIDVEARERIDRIEVGDGPCKVVVDERSDQAFVANSLASTVARIDLSTRRVVAEHPVGRAPVGLALGAHGDRLYVCNRGAGSVSVLATGTGQEWGRMPVANGPGDVAVDPVTGRVLVSNAGSAALTVLEDRHSGAPSTAVSAPRHPLVGKKLPSFALPDVRTRQLRHSREWAEKKYILNFFASW